jgi:hypothetical protein
MLRPNEYLLVTPKMFRKKISLASFVRNFCKELKFTFCAPLNITSKVYSVRNRLLCHISK